MDNSDPVVVEGMQNMQIHQSETDADSGVDESTQNATSPNKANNGTIKANSGTNSRIPKKTPPATPHHKSRGRSTDDKSFVPRRPVRSKSVPKPFTSFALTAPILDDSVSPVKKVPMNKIKVGMTSSPNLKKIQSKVGSLSNASYKPGGGDFKIKSQKLDWKAQPKTVALNNGYTPKGGDKKIEHKKLEWNITSKVGSLDNTSHRPGGGEKRIASQKLEWKANSKVGSIDNIKHKPGGGNIKIENRKIDLNVESKVGSLANVKHRAGGGDKKVFNDIEYLKQMNDTTGAQLMAKSSGQNSECSSRRESAVQSSVFLMNNNSLTKQPVKSRKSGNTAAQNGPVSLDFLRSIPKSKPTNEVSSGTYKYQMRRRLSPMSSGF